MKEMFTVHMGYKTDDRHCITKKVLADTKEEAKEVVWKMIIEENPEAEFTHANARKSKRV